MKLNAKMLKNHMKTNKIGSYALNLFVCVNGSNKNQYQYISGNWLKISILTQHKVV